MSIKKPSYYSRFQTKKRRRREGKTDYTLRRKLIQPNYKTYSNTKYRLVVRTTNKRVILQITRAYLNGDQVLIQADSNELKQFGITFGLKNLSAHYLTGLLIGKKIQSLKEQNKEEFKNIGSIFLDIGLKRSSKGAKVFIAMKGAVDSGLNIPYSCKIFPGFKKGDDNETFDSTLLQEKITGKILKNYMELLFKENQELYNKQFSDFIKLKVDSSNIVQLYESAIEKINNFTYQLKENTVKSNNKFKEEAKKYQLTKLSLEDRKLNIKNKLETIKE